MSEYIKMNDTIVYNYQNDIIKELNKELARFRPFKSAYEMKKEIERLHSIIKEVKEILKDYGTKEDIVDYSNYTITGGMLYKILEILDKDIDKE